MLRNALENSFQIQNFAVPFGCTTTLQLQNGLEKPRHGNQKGVINKHKFHFFPLGMNQHPITGAFWVGSKRPDPWRLAFSLSVAIFASPVILDFRLRSWPGSLGDQKHRDAASKLRNGVRTCLYF